MYSGSGMSLKKSRKVWEIRHCDPNGMPAESGKQSESVSLNLIFTYLLSRKLLEVLCDHWELKPVTELILEFCVPNGVEIFLYLFYDECCSVVCFVVVVVVYINVAVDINNNV